jgi:hypothetical protein
MTKGDELQALLNDLQDAQSYIEELESERTAFICLLVPCGILGLALLSVVAVGFFVSEIIIRYCRGST